MAHCFNCGERKIWQNIGKSQNIMKLIAAIGHYSVILRHFQSLAQRLHTQKPGMLGILQYLEPFHNGIPTHIQNLVIFAKIYRYLDL